MAEIKSLEHNTLKVPYEVLNKRFRVAQKVIDRDVSLAEKQAKEIEESVQRPITMAEMSTMLDKMVDNLSALKRKADEAIQSEIDSTHCIKRRLQHLQEVEHFSTHKLPLWQKTRLDRMLVEYFLRAGYYNAAVCLADHSNIKDLTNIDLFMTSKMVEESLKQRETSLCLSWCNENRSKLKKYKSTLEFNIRKQEFIELIRNDCCIDAVKHARKYFTHVEGDQVGEVQKIMGLLAYNEHSSIQLHEVLFADSRWADLVHQFRRDNFQLHQLSSTVFSAALQAGLSSLKTPHCYKQDCQRSSNCPVCSRHLNELAQPLPYAHCSNSRLMCTISGEPLNEYNPPMMLPNGNIYGLQYRHDSAGHGDHTPSRQSQTTTGDMLTAPFASVYQPLVPSTFHARARKTYLTSNPFSNHDNRNSHQDHSEYFGNRKTRSLGRRLPPASKCQHRTPFDFFNHNTHKLAVDESHTEGIIMSTEVPIEEQTVYRLFSRTYPSNFSSQGPMSSSTTKWFDDSLDGKFQRSIKPSTKTLAISQQPYLQHNDWKYACKSKPNAYPPCSEPIKMQYVGNALNQYGAAFVNTK